MISLDENMLSIDDITGILRKCNNYYDGILPKITRPENAVFKLRELKIDPGEFFFRSLADELDCTFIEPDVIKSKSYLASTLPFAVLRKNLIFLLKIDGSKITVVTSNPLNKKLFVELSKIFKKQVEICVSTTEAIEYAIDKGYREIHRDKAIGQLRDRKPDESAYKVVYPWQRNILIIIIVFFFTFLAYDFNLVLLLILWAVNILYFFVNPFKLYISFRGFENSGEGVVITPEEIEELDDSTLPVYTILIPVFKEANVLPDLISNINNLDYPKEKLDVKILLEENDSETINAAKRIGLIGEPEVIFEGMSLLEYKEFTKIFDITIIPDASIKTKPRACNYGLYRARGEYCVIYDAEDDPDPDQLKKAVIAFRKLPDEYVCLQSHLNFYNPKENLLARWFSLEYSFWFDYYLQGLNYVGAPLPLGGTSNHFITKVLYKLGGWDPYNVTEDADLGIRISARKYNTAMLNSFTLEEANLRVWNWIRQRSRWNKGYIQTFLVHTRFPLKLYKELGFKTFMYLVFTFGGNIFLPLINPILWIVTLVTMFLPDTAAYLFTPEIETICSFNLIVGNLIYIGLHLGPSIIKRDYASIPVALLIPLYWLMVSFAAWKGLLQLITNPFYWEKTDHGISKVKKQAVFKSIN
jgi:cellulose synthase/poly-beta-1,6-N-acetylglucosamine synthase-like glycosyltransferase